MEAEYNHRGQEQLLEAGTVALHDQNYPCGWQEWWPFGEASSHQRQRGTKEVGLGVTE